jgi:multiple sugar transport system substrate-binding protein
MKTLRIALRRFVDFENALASQIASFCAEQPGVSIEFVPMDLHALYRELIAEDGLRSGRWDLALLVTDWLPECIDRGLLEDLGPHMNAQPIPGWPQAWPRSLTEPLVFDNTVYCIPWHDGPECLICRRDLFASPREQAAFRDRFGYELAPPRTWQQFEDVARFFTRPADGLWGTAFACYPDGHNTLYDFALQVWSRGGELHDDTGRPTLVTPQSVDALDFYRRIVRDPAASHPDSINADSVRSGELFLSGAVACMVNWFGFAARSGRSGAPLDGRVSLAPIPASQGVPPVSLSAFWSMAIAAGSPNKETAWAFLRFLARPEMDLTVVRHGAVGVRLSTWRDPEVRRSTPAYESIESISAGARRLPRTPSLPEFAAIVNAVVERALHTDESSHAILHSAQQQAIEKNVRFL